MAATVDLQRRAIRLEYLTIAWNTAEAVIALVAGFMAGSIALVGFGLDSVIEVFAASIVLWQLRSDVPEDRERHALKLIAVSFYALAAFVTVVAVRDLVVHAEPDESIPGIVLTALSLSIMWFLASAKHRTGHQIENRALIADSRETMLCSYLSAVVLVGLALNAWWGLWWADPAAALGIASLAAREGREAWTGEHPEHH